MRVRLMAWGVIGVLGLISAAVQGVQNSVRAGQIEPFKSHIGEYLALENSATDSNTAHIKGKVLIVDVAAREVENAFFDLPEELRATTPGDVGTVCLVRWSTEEVGKYDHGQTAFRYIGSMTCIDKDRKMIIGGPQTYRGSDPPSRKKQYASPYGSKPIGAMIGQIRGWSRK